MPVCNRSLDKHRFWLRMNISINSKLRTVLGGKFPRSSLKNPACSEEKTRSQCFSVSATCPCRYGRQNFVSTKVSNRVSPLGEKTTTALDRTPTARRLSRRFHGSFASSGEHLEPQKRQTRRPAPRKLGRVLSQGNQFAFDAYFP